MARASCKDVLASNRAAATGLYTVYPGGVSTQVYCDMTTAGGGWTQVLDQDCNILPPSATDLSQWAGPYNPTQPNQGQYSILNLLDQLKSGPNYEFLMVYPTSPGAGTLQWTQVENPTTFTSPVSRPTISGLVTDPSPMTDDGPNAFTGLGRTVSGNSYLSGDSRALNVGNWWFALGEVMDFGAGIPSYANPSAPPFNGAQGTPRGQLYVR